MVDMRTLAEARAAPTDSCEVLTIPTYPGAPPLGWCELHMSQAAAGIGGGLCLWARLCRTGVPFREVARGAYTGHFQIFPASNLEPWSPEQETALREAARRADCGATRELCIKDGRGFRTKLAEPGRGLRFYRDGGA